MKTHARCAFCGQKMEPGNGCTVELEDDGAIRTRFGDEADDWGADNGPCHDCAVTKGQNHHPGCDVERCPICDGQIITCGCFG
jgi:hypothetical protein